MRQSIARLVGVNKARSRESTRKVAGVGVGIEAGTGVCRAYIVG
jgi:hypothetical protein